MYLLYVHNIYIYIYIYVYIYVHTHVDVQAWKNSSACGPQIETAMSVASEPSLAAPSLAVAAPTPPPVPIFTVWDSTSGESADVLLHWHRSLPQLPEDEEPLCTLQVCMQGQELEFLEARLQKHHLQPPLAAWTGVQVERLMAVMADQRCGIPPNQDEVRLRRAPGRLVIDVHFRSEGSDPGSSIPLSGCVVEILNAYPPEAQNGTSLEPTRLTADSEAQVREIHAKRDRGRVAVPTARCQGSRHSASTKER